MRHHSSNGTHGRLIGRATTAPARSGRHRPRAIDPGRSGEGVAHNYFSNVRHLFGWAIGTGEFGLKESPMANLSPKSLIGVRVVRKRVLTDDELRAVWNAAGELHYPYRDVVRLLILTG